MGRSVARPSDAVETVYLHEPHRSPDEDGDYDGYDAQDDWDYFCEDLQNVVRERFPSFQEDSTWVGNEEKSILENGHARIVVAEYCGTVSVSLVPLEHTYSYDNRGLLAAAWCRQVADSFRQHLHKRYPQSAMTRLGSMSNGEAVYRKVDG